MDNKFSVNHLANNIQTKKSPSFLAKLFKNALLKKFKRLKLGQLILEDRDETYIFGDTNSNMIAKVKILSPEFYVFIGSGGEMGAAEAYIAGYWQSDNLVNAIQIIFKNKSVLESLNSGLAKLAAPINYFIHRKRQNTLLGSKKNILAHYDLSNEFYQLWLDETMTYSCGIFLDKNSTMKEASVEKLDRFCRKLKLTEGDQILEIGTGWGSFAIHAAKHYGCKVTTTTISDAQFNYVSNLIEKEGLGSKIKLLNQDYRDLKGQYDKLVSIEMIEAVGTNYISNFFNKSSSLLKPDGLMGLQGITYNDQNFDVYKDSVDFTKKYIFPGSCLISISQITDAIKFKTDLTLIDLEDITQHYATTLNRWRKKFMSVLPQVRQLGFSEAFIKMWEFYFIFCEAGFLERNIGDVQLVFAKPEARDVQISN